MHTSHASKTIRAFGLVALPLGALAVIGPGCASSGLRPSKGALPAVGDVTGTWEGTSDRTLDADGPGPGDRETQRHIWRLRQVGDQVRGVVFVELTLESGDGRPYLCSGRTRLTAWLTSDVEGHREGSRLVLRERSRPRVDGPCPPPSRPPARYEALLQDEALAVAGAEAPQRLVRRELIAPRQTPTTAELAIEAPAPSLAFMAPPRPGEPSVPPVQSAPALFAGHWVWERHDQLPSGDAKREREEWHLVQEGTEVVGFYDRVVEQRSNDGRLYRCNGALDFRTVTRYQVRGEVLGAQFMLSELSFEVMEGGPCDDGRRQLDAYQGELRDSQIVLQLGLGRQVLRRARPMVPTQSF